MVLAVGRRAARAWQSRVSTLRGGLHGVVAQQLRKLYGQGLLSREDARESLNGLLSAAGFTAGPEQDAVMDDFGLGVGVGVGVGGKGAAGGEGGSSGGAVGAKGQVAMEDGDGPAVAG